MATELQVERALADWEPILLKMANQIAVSASLDAFRQQAWDGVPWAPRYPGQRAPKVNVAGLLRDINIGGRDAVPKTRRFQDRPALRDTNRLRDSIAEGVHITGPNEVEVGSNMEYADTQQMGGTSRQPVTEGAKAWLEKHIGAGRGRRYRAYADALRPLMAKDELVTQVVGRQFIGVTRQMELDMAELLVRMVDRL